MKPKTTLILLLLLIAVGGFYWFWGIKGQETRERQQELANRILPMEQENINRVALVQAGDTTVVYEQSDDEWTITHPVQTSADQTRIETNLNAFLEAEQKRIIATELTDLQPYGLDRPQAEVAITYNDTGKVTLLIGNQNPTGSSVYAKRDDGPSIYTTNTNIVSQGKKQLFDLRDRSIAKFDRNAITKIVISRENGETLEFNKMDGDWRLAEPQVKAQNSQVSSLLSGLATRQVQEYFEETPVNLDDYGLDNPRILVSLFTNDTTRTAAVQIGNAVDDSNSPDYYARDLSRPMIFSVGNNVVTNIRKSPFEFQDKGLFAINSGQVTDMKVSWNDTTYQVSKIDTAWKMMQPVEAQADADKAQRMARSLSNVQVDSLGSYTQTDPARYGFDAPWMEVRFHISGSEFDGFTVGDPANDTRRYITTDSSPYVYEIRPSKLNEFQLSLDDIVAESEQDTTTVATGE
ncbi:MAG TPA: DUF4340 domain-containing protein [bacterium]|nr:DUF4340 domain-containing protein [bacterium]